MSVLSREQIEQFIEKKLSKTINLPVLLNKDLSTSTSKRIMLYTITHPLPIKPMGAITLEDVEKAVENALLQYTQSIRPEVATKKSESESPAEIVPEGAGEEGKKEVRIPAPKKTISRERSGIIISREKDQAPSREKEEGSEEGKEEVAEGSAEEVPEGSAEGEEGESKSEEGEENVKESVEQDNLEELKKDITVANEDLNNYKNYLFLQKEALENIDDYSLIKNTLLQLIEKNEEPVTGKNLGKQMFKYSLLHAATHMFLTRNPGELGISDSYWNDQLTAWLRCVEKELQGKEDDEEGQLEVLYRMVSFALTRGLCELFKQGFFGDYKLRTLLDRLAEKAAEHRAKEVQTFMQRTKENLEETCKNTTSLQILTCSSHFDFAVFIMGEIAQLEEMMRTLTRKTNMEKLPVVPKNAEELVKTLEELEQGYNEKIDPNLKRSRKWSKRAAILGLIFGLASSRFAKVNQDTYLMNYAGLPGVAPPLYGNIASGVSMWKRNPIENVSKPIFDPSWCSTHNCTEEEKEQMVDMLFTDDYVDRVNNAETWNYFNSMIGSRIGKERLQKAEAERKVAQEREAAEAQERKVEAERKAAEAIQRTAKASRQRRLIAKAERHIAAEAERSFAAERKLAEATQNAQNTFSRDPRLFSLVMNPPPIPND